MKKKDKVIYTGPLTGVEEFDQDRGIDSVHDALQTTWETVTKEDEQIHCEQGIDE